MLADEKNNMEVSSLIVYLNSGKANRYYVGWDNKFTIKALYRLGFAWPLTGERYIEFVILTFRTVCCK